MNRISLVAVAATIAASMAAGGAFAHDDPKKASNPGHAAHAGHSAGSMELHRIMTQGASKPMPMSGNVDKDFAAMMSMHHQQAIQMADVVAKHGKSPELKALARKMQEAQRKEIKQLAPYTK